jgi:transposase-like protein
MNLPVLIEQFGSEDRCRAYLEDLRWPDGIECPRCHGRTISRIRDRNQFDCDSCRYQFSVTAGTIFHDTHLGLWKWFLATYLMVESKKGISAKQLQRTLGIKSYKTAWYLAHRIRDAMGSVEESPLVGVVEVDETLVGGKRKDVGRGFRENKSVVIGAIQRGGNVKLRVIPNTRRGNVERFIADAVSEPEAIFTDELKSYNRLSEDGTRHETVEHKADEFVRGDVHTNTVESVWSLFKRSLIGSYHQVSIKHLPAYLDELEWRFNGRRNPYLFRDTLLVLLHSDPLPLQELVGRKGPSYGVKTAPPITPLDPEGHT